MDTRTYRNVFIMFVTQYKVDLLLKSGIDIGDITWRPLSSIGFLHGPDSIFSELAVDILASSSHIENRDAFLNRAIITNASVLVIVLYIIHIHTHWTGSLN